MALVWNKPTRSPFRVVRCRGKGLHALPLQAEWAGLASLCSSANLGLNLSAVVKNQCG